MNTLERISTFAERDPIAVSIEDYLHREATLGHGPLKMDSRPGEATVRFGNVTARGETDDIALVRLARSLLDDERFSEALMDLLRGLVPVHG